MTDDPSRLEQDLSAAVLEVAASLIVVLDREGRIVRFNRACERATGYTEAEVRGRRPWELLYRRDDEAGVRAAFESLAAGDFPLHREGVWVARDGSLRRIAWSSTAIPGPEGEPTYLVATGIDVTERREAEEALRREHDFARQVMETMGQGLTVTDREARILYANPAYARLVGREQEALLGRVPAEWTHPDDLTTFWDAYQRRRAGETTTYETRLVRADGGVVHALITGMPRWEDGEIAGAIAAVSNLSRRKVMERALRESEESFRTLVENASDIIFRTDPEGCFTYVSPAASRILGYPEEHLLGVHFRDLVRPDQRAVVDAFYGRQFEERTPSTYLEFPAVAADGRETWIGQSVRLELDGGRVTGTLSIARDITARREVERLKDEFVGVVSHELRTPLTSLRGSLGLLATGRLDAERSARMLEVAVQNTDRLVRLINDFLDLERIESGKIPMEVAPARAGELVALAVDELRGTAERAGVRITVEPGDAEVAADADRIVQVLVNLLSNAVKFSHAGSEVRVRAEERGPEVLVRVADRGRGIPPDKVESIFERFRQVDSSDSRAMGGTGLGLAICRSIVRQHGGRIWVASDPGAGSTFFFTLPALARQAPVGGD